MDDNVNRCGIVMTIVSSSFEFQFEASSSIVSNDDPVVAIWACAHALSVGEDEGKLRLGESVGTRFSEGGREGFTEGEVVGD